MSSNSKEMVSQIRNRFCNAGQGHVFTWWDDLSTDERNRLFQQLTCIDLDLMQRLIEENLEEPAGKERVLESTPMILLPETPEDLTHREKARQVGESVIRAGKCAALMAAGSGGSDQGLPRAKGTYPITPVTGKPLFQLHAEKVLAAGRKFGVNIPLFVMTSPDNHEETRSFFEAHQFFGLPGDEIFFFSQGMLPAVDRSGKLLMTGKSELCMSPDGHGGSIRSLHASGALDELESRGLEYICYFQVDNPLVKIVDPPFIGFHHMAGAEISSKVVKKRSPEERVGVLGKVNGALGVVEYSDLTKEEMYARDESGAFKHHAGNIAIHLLNVSFVRKFSDGTNRLSYHKSERAFDHINSKGEPVAATGKNAIKYESFIFDALRFAGNSVILEVAREEEFSPFKSLDGEDSLDQCRRMLSAHYKSWLEKAGFKVRDGDDTLVEISPLFALEAEEFSEKVRVRGEIFSEKLFIE